MGIDFNSDELQKKLKASRLKFEQQQIEREKQEAAERKEWEQGPDKWVEYIRSLNYAPDRIKAKDGGIVITGADGKRVWFDPVFLTRIDRLEPEFCDTTYDTDSIVGDIIFALYETGFDEMKHQLVEYEAEARQWDRPHKKRPQIDDPKGYRVIN